MAEAALAMRLRAIEEGRPGERLASVFREYWPGYRRWMRRSAPASVEACIGQVRSVTPELFPIFEELLDAFGGGDDVARFLTLYDPPRLVRGCSQLVIDDDGPVLVRTYDHSPMLFDGLVLRSEWGESATLATTDCLWGALDGVNDRGLAVALAFGGRNVVGKGFGAQLVTRYILETCGDVIEAQRVLERVPVFMPYTFVLCDASGDFSTIFTGPDVPVRVVKRRASTNLQTLGDWPAYQAQTQSIERLRCVEALLSDGPTTTDVVEAFLSPPVWRTDYSRGSGTLYVAVYRARERTLEMHWPTSTEVFSLAEFDERELEVQLEVGG